MALKFVKVPKQVKNRRQAKNRKTQINPSRQALRDSTVRVGEYVSRKELQKAGWQPLTHATAGVPYPTSYINYQRNRKIDIGGEGGNHGKVYGVKRASRGFKYNRVGSPSDGPVRV